ncbi:glycosyltransferase [Streptomyces sp. NPDC060022]|uniref:glycosyltransferase n=1 Tax=Streptomyces sp. NPDC060022 TaxID=3347039 RepID=UPI0036775551
MRGRQHRTALVVPGSLTKYVGGAPLRWKALHRAMRAQGPVLLAECAERDTCGSVCAVSGGPTGQWRAPQYFYDRMYCEAWAESLLRRFREAGITTVVCSGLRTYRYVLRFALESDLRVVFDLHGIESVLHDEIDRAKTADPAVGNFPRKDNSWMRELEESAVLAADAAWTATDADLKLLRATYPRCADVPVTVVPNAVDPSDYSFEPGAVDRVVFTGRLDYYPNVEALDCLERQVVPRLRASGADLPVVAAGACPDPSLPGRYRAVRVVPDPPDPVSLLPGGVMAVPVRIGGGSRFKILEAMASGVPVVTTPKGIEGLDVRDGEHCLVAADAASMAAAIRAVATGGALRTRLTAAARLRVRDSHSVGAIIPTVAKSLS